MKITLSSPGLHQLMWSYQLSRHKLFLQGIVEYRILPKWMEQSVGIALPWIELGLAVALMLGIALQIVGTAFFVLLLCFTTAVIINLRRGRNIKCNCYTIAGVKFIGWGIVGRNILLLIFVTTTVLLAQNAVNADQWLTIWRADFLTITSISSAVLLLLMLATLIVTVLPSSSHLGNTAC